MKEKISQVLKETFGYTNFREKQDEVILNVLEKNDTLAVMPTGSGKSLCYQIPALIFDGLTVVVSPLISLMQDQVDQLKSAGVDTILLNSSLTREKYFENIDKLKNQSAKLLYVAPETLMKPYLLDLLSSLRVDCFTIDEAHCISEWGHDFRPEYRRLAEVRKKFSNAVCIALTATATERVRKDIRQILTQQTNQNQFDTYITSFNRKNLFIEIKEKINAYQQTIEFIDKFPNQSGIIYCFSRKQVDELSSSLSNLKYNVKPYHAGLNETQRINNQKAFTRDDVQIIVATVAFGMGINKPNVRFVLHHDLPKNIESYYQEIGRAGRDGLNAHCLLLFSYGDTQKIRFFINQKSEEEQRIANIHLNSLVALAETNDCRRIPMLQYFGENYNIANCEFCDNCTGEKKELVDITIEAQKFLSCVKRTGEMYGATYVIDVLRGSKIKKILSNNHQELSTYGIGNDYSKKQWQHLSRQFIKHGLLKQDLEFGGLSLTQKAYLCFKNELKIKGIIKKEITETYKLKSKDSTLDYDQKLFDILRKRRKNLADEQNVPPYVIFSDKTLIEISSYFPTSIEELLNIHGIGKSKIEKYSDMVIHLVEDYIKENNIQQDELKKSEILSQKRQIRPQEKTHSETGKELRYITVGKAYNNGMSIEELVANFNVQQKTIIDYLYKYFYEGNKAKRNDFLSIIEITDELLEIVTTSFNEHGALKLKPIFEDLKQTISYDDLHILRLHYLTMTE